MSIRNAARRAALVVPPLRRLYHFTRQISADYAECRLSLHQLREECDLITRQREGERAQLADLLSKNSALEQQLDNLNLERESAELQLYVMRSDQQRAATRNESLAKLLQESSHREKDTRSRVASLMKELRGSNSRFRKLCSEPPSTDEKPISDILADSQRQLEAKLEVFYAKLAGRITILSSEVTGLHRERPVREAEAGHCTTARRLYLDLLEKALSGTLIKDQSIAPWARGFDPDVRAIGRDWPSCAQTMIGTARLRNLRVLAEQVVLDGIPGDMLEAGVWRGGACILMQGVLEAYGVRDRSVWVADSFEGLPLPDGDYPADAGDQHSTFKELAVSLDEVRDNFATYNLLDDRVRFLKGWFSDTLKQAPITKLSILRLDGDMYSSTIQTLDALYSKVSSGGFIIVDDYILEGCRKAVDDFRRDHGVEDRLQEVDGAAVYWRKSRD